MPEVIEISPQELTEVKAAYAEMLTHIKSIYTTEDKAQMDAAFELANHAHRHQRRKSGELYIFHPIAVSKIAAQEIGLGPTAIQAALLHDVVEDTPVTLGDIREKFGDTIAKMVDGLTKLDSAYQEESQQAANFKKVLSTLVVDVRIVLVKMADRLHNMRTLGSMPENKQLKIAAETSYIYAPLAHRLGLYTFRSEFLDLCMKILEREEYNAVAQKLQETKKSREAYIDEFLAPIKEKVDELEISYRAFGRPKSIYSIANKIRKKQVPFEQIYDLFAVRIIIDVPREKEKALCWNIYSIITDFYQAVPERLKDWITIPKSNGYESLHTTVVGPNGRFVEVQVRSERMDEIAERGFAAHWKYKGVSGQKDVYERWFDSVRDILDDPSSDTVTFLGDFRDNSFFNEEVYVYTPDGDMKVLPKGATALDFAFSVHSMVGYHCQSILVDERIVPMHYKLKNGDRLKINTSPKQKPNEGWLQFVTTGKAKSKIRSAMREERKQQGELGKEALIRKLNKLDVKDQQLAIESLANHYFERSTIDLFYAIATGSLTVAQIFKAWKVEKGELKLIPVEQPPAPEPGSGRSRNTANKVNGKSNLLINGEPASQYDYSMANCCNPVQGDQVFAYITATAGLKIHRSNCPNAENLMANYGYRVKKAQWVSTTEHSFVAELQLTGLDSGKGVIEDLTRAISELNLSIRSLNIAGDGGFFSANIRIFVINTDQLNVAIRALQQLENVNTVSRVQ
ncbi:RelA/SpoT family protein [Lewinellaceae bacterium SD302]|nr:RelA/SpoT family protein [Lewinellaceae bacterium SD302]